MIGHFLSTSSRQVQVEEIQRMGALLGDEEVPSWPPFAVLKDWMDGIFIFEDLTGSKGRILKKATHKTNDIRLKFMYIVI